MHVLPMHTSVKWQASEKGAHPACECMWLGQALQLSYVATVLQVLTADRLRQPLTFQTILLVSKTGPPKFATR